MKHNSGLRPFAASAILALAIALCACAQPSPPTAQDTAAMPTSDKPNFRHHTLAENPDLTPEEMGRRFLKLIDSIHSDNDLTPERIQEVMRIPMYTTGYHGYGFGIHLPESGWYYNLSYSDDPQMPDSMSVDYSFYNKVENADMEPVCGMDFDAYDAALKAMGFKERPDLARYDTGENGQIVRWRPRVTYTRNDVTVWIDLCGQANSPEAKLNHTCVKIIGVRIVKVGD